MSVFWLALLQVHVFTCPLYDARLNKTQPHYVRCVKPNEDKAAQIFVPRMCFEQLTYSGVFEVRETEYVGFSVWPLVQLVCDHDEMTNTLVTICSDLFVYFGVTACVPLT